MKGLQHWTAYPPLHAAPATPEDHPDHFRFTCLDASAFPFCPQSRHLRFSLTRLHLGSLALRPAALPSGNLRPLITQTPLPCATGVHGQFPGRDFNPLDNTVVTANGQQRPFSYRCPYLISGNSTVLIANSMSLFLIKIMAKDHE